MFMNWITRLDRSVSATGLLVGTLFLAASLTPSLIPRTDVLQGVLSGVAMAAGYGAGMFLRWLWSYLEIPAPGWRVERTIKSGVAAVCVIVVVVYLWRASEWQNAIRVLMELDPVDTMHPLRVGVIALGVCGGLIAVAWLFHRTFVFFSGSFNRVVPRRVSHALGIAAALTLFWALVDGVLGRALLHVADVSYQEFDALMEPEMEPPATPARTGSGASLVSWQDLGRAGRHYISRGPTAGEIGSFLGENVPEPIRVYVGLNSRDTVEARAQLALDELKRAGGFERSVLIIATPTGTGWLDPAALDTVEYLHRGDIATVALQYSYLPSWLSLLVEPGYGASSARALFTKIYGHWTALPESERPRLYLQGVSLGALNSDRSADLFDIVGDPFHGALWSGPPFASETWRMATAERIPESPPWLPRFRDGSIIRFKNQESSLTAQYGAWGPLRIVFLQYASDPVTFLEPAALYREPEWMKGQRGPDVSQRFRWFPVVTLLQLTVDAAVATSTPPGYGHVYAPDDYIDAWVAMTEPAGWSNRQLERLKGLGFRTAGAGARDETERDAH